MFFKKASYPIRASFNRYYFTDPKKVCKAVFSLLKLSSDEKIILRNALKDESALIFISTAEHAKILKKVDKFKHLFSFSRHTWKDRPNGGTERSIR